MNIRTKAIVIILSVFLLAGGIITITFSKKAAPTDDLQAHKKTDKPLSTPSEEKDDDLPKIYNSNRNKQSIVQIPPEPIYKNQAPAPSPVLPKVISDAVVRLKKSNPTSRVGTTWDAFLQKEPTIENLRFFLDSLDTPQLFELMEYTSDSDPSFASGFIEIAIIPELKARWSQDESPWENQVPYDQLLQIASDKQKPELLRQVMIDLLGACKGMTNDNRDVVLEQMSQGLAVIIEDIENAGDTRAYAITDLGLISQQLHGDASPYSELFLRLAQDSSEDMSVRVRSLQMLPMLDEMQAITVLEDSCMNYQPEDNAAIAKATMVALSDYAQKGDVDVLEPISRVLVVTLDPEAFSAGVYATSRLDESSFMTALPMLIAEKGRFQDDTLVEDSIHAALWRQPDAVMNAINSDDEEMVRAGIEAACYVPLPPIKERLQELLAASSPEQQGKIRKALEKTEDIEGYEQIKNQLSKEKEEFDEEPNKTTD